VTPPAREPVLARTSGLGEVAGPGRAVPLPGAAALGWAEGWLWGRSEEPRATARRRDRRLPLLAAGSGRGSALRRAPRSS